MLYLPTDISNLLDLDDLVLQDSSFIDETMQKHQTDLLYAVRLTTGEKAFVYFLFEHKSYPDPLVGLQLLRYMVRFWERQTKEGTGLSPIIPLVIYHGEKAWHTPTEFIDLLGAPEALRPFLPDFRYHLTDFSWLSDETIRGTVWLRVATAVLRAVRNPHLKDELDDLVTLMFELDQQRTGLEYIRTILYYLGKATDRVDREDLKKALLSQGTQGENVVATIAQEYIQEGYKKGVERGMERGMKEAKRNIARQLLDSYDIQEISLITGLHIDEITALHDYTNQVRS